MTFTIITKKLGGVFLFVLAIERLPYKYDKVTLEFQIQTNNEVAFHDLITFGPQIYDIYDKSDTALQYQTKGLIPRKACKTGTFGIHKTGQKSTSIIK